MGLGPELLQGLPAPRWCVKLLVQELRLTETDERDLGWAWDCLQTVCICITGNVRFWGCLVGRFTRAPSAC